MVKDHDGNDIPTGQYINPNDLPNNSTVEVQGFEVLKHQHNSAMEYIVELEEKVKNLVTKNIELENKIGTGLHHQYHYNQRFIA